MESQDGEQTDTSRDLSRWRSEPGRRLAGLAVGASDRLRGRLDDRAAPYAVLMATALIGLVLTGLLTAASGEIYDSVIDRDGLAGLDRPVLDLMASWRTPGLNAAVTHYTDLGSPAVMPVLTVVAAGLLAWLWRSWTPVLVLTIGAGGSLLMTGVGKSLVDRARPAQHLAVPPYETSPSFPSGHALNSWVILALIAYLLVSRVRGQWLRTTAIVLAVALSAAMGLSRVYLGHHWLTDVLVAWTLGTAWLVVVITGHRLALTVLRRRRAPDSSPTDG